MVRVMPILLEESLKQVPLSKWGWAGRMPTALAWVVTRLQVESRAHGHLHRRSGTIVSLRHSLVTSGELVKSPAGAYQWKAVGEGADTAVPDAHDPAKRHAPMMTTADLALRQDPIYEPISRRFYENPDEFADAFARAWFKLTHRDMGPIECYLGSEVPSEELIWQDPVPNQTGELINDSEYFKPKS